MPQFFVPPKNILGSDFYFDTPESRHLLKVLRIKEGDSLQIFDGEGLTYSAKITDTSNPARVRGKIFESQEIRDASRHLKVKIYPALFKGPGFEWMVQKVTELGVYSIQPILTKRTIISLNEEKVGSKLERWKKIILAAAKQCGRSSLPEIYKPLKFRDAVNKINKEDLKLILWEGENEFKISETFENNKKISGTVHLFLGPEGGFAIDEIDFVKNAGFQSIRLTENILRAETAAIASVSYLLLQSSGS